MNIDINEILADMTSVIKKTVAEDWSEVKTVSIEFLKRRKERHSYQHFKCGLIGFCKLLPLNLKTMNMKKIRLASVFILGCTFLSYQSFGQNQQITQGQHTLQPHSTTVLPAINGNQFNQRTVQNNLGSTQVNATLQQSFSNQTSADIQSTTPVRTVKKSDGVTAAPRAHRRA